MKPIETILRTFIDQHPEDAARAFEALNTDEAARLLKNLPIRVVASLIERLSPHQAASLVVRLDAHRVLELLEVLPPRTGSTVFKHLEEDKREEVLATLPEKSARLLRELADYPPETAGGMMEPKVASLTLDLTAQQAITAIRKAPRDALHYLYVTKRNSELVGVLNMRDLLLATAREPIEPLVHQHVLSVPVTMDRDEVIDLMTERGFLALPVVDAENRLIGVVKHDTALEAGQLEAFEDMQKSVGVGGDERALSPVSTVIKRRLPWLYVNLLTAFMAAAVVGLFEGVIAQVTALAVLLPVVAGQGGNTGSQSLAIVMRGLALREIVPGTQLRVVLKEVISGTLNGVAIAIVTALGVYLWYQSGGLALVIGGAMVVNMSAAAFSGAIIPLLLKSLGRDPAQSAAIFLTTVTDIIGFSSFLGFALFMMPWLPKG
ncbi:MAG TPA: magnesium transporter [Pirellulaceae bacterium]|nr:magnesium transporter [Pirellulaceae bacterium]